MEHIQADYGMIRWRVCLKEIMNLFVQKIYETIQQMIKGSQFRFGTNSVTTKVGVVAR